MLKERILYILKDERLTVEKLYYRLKNVPGYKVDVCIEELQIDGIVFNVSDPGAPIGWHDKIGVEA